MGAIPINIFPRPWVGDRMVISVCSLKSESELSVLTLFGFYDAVNLDSVESSQVPAR